MPDPGHPGQKNPGSVCASGIVLAIAMPAPYGEAPLKDHGEPLLQGRPALPRLQDAKEKTDALRGPVSSRFGTSSGESFTDELPR
jgi:hypothetical protein